MKKLSLCTLVALALLVSSAAIAQAGGPQGTQGSSPGASQPGSPSQQQPGYPSSQQPGASGSSGQMSQDQNSQTKSEKKIKGCVQSEGGQSVLQTKKGNVNLTGQDVSAHNGHEVALKGTWESGGGSSAAASSGSSGKTFNVEKVDMISETCGGKKGSSGSMGTSSPSGSGGNTGTQPPQ
jgi:hypothetical protein